MGDMIAAAREPARLLLGGRSGFRKANAFVVARLFIVAATLGVRGSGDHRWRRTGDRSLFGGPWPDEPDRTAGLPEIMAEATPIKVPDQVQLALERNFLALERFWLCQPGSVGSGWSYCVRVTRV